MRKELREKIIAYNREVVNKGAKASDLDALVHGISLLPKGQLKKLMSEEIIEILEKYGVDVKGEEHGD